MNNTQNVNKEEDMNFPGLIMPIKPKPLLRTISNLSRFTINNSKSNDSLGQRWFAHQNNWEFLRNRLVHAKMSDLFHNIKFTINGKTITALRCIGEGGYSRGINSLFSLIYCLQNFSFKL